jgi:hypothetical protein
MVTDAKSEYGLYRREVEVVVVSQELFVSLYNEAFRLPLVWLSLQQWLSPFQLVQKRQMASKKIIQ